MCLAVRWNVEVEAGFRAGFPTNKRNGRTRQLSNAECDRIDFTGLAEKKVCVCVCPVVFCSCLRFSLE